MSTTRTRPLGSVAAPAPTPARPHQEPHTGRCLFLWRPSSPGTHTHTHTPPATGRSSRPPEKASFIKAGGGLPFRTTFALAMQSKDLAACLVFLCTGSRRVGPAQAGGRDGTHLDLEGLLQLLDDRLSVLQLEAETLCVRDLCPQGGCPQLHGESHLKGRPMWASSSNLQAGSPPPPTAGGRVCLPTGLLLEQAHTTAPQVAPKCATSTQAAGAPPPPSPWAHLALGPVGVVLAFLHGGGHLVHGGDEDAAGLAQTLVGVQAVRAVDLRRKWAGGLSGNPQAILRAGGRAPPKGPSGPGLFPRQEHAARGQRLCRAPNGSGGRKRKAGCGSSKEGAATRWQMPLAVIASPAGRFGAKKSQRGA